MYPVPTFPPPHPQVNRGALDQIFSHVLDLATLAAVKAGTERPDLATILPAYDADPVGETLKLAVKARCDLATL